MDKEYIEREAVLRRKRKMSGADFGGEFWDEAVLCEEIWKIPKADVAEVKHGHWNDGICTNCGFAALYYSRGTVQVYTDYCPNCGAKMDLEV